MRWLKALLLRAALYVSGSLALVLGLFFGAQLIFPELRAPREVPDSVLFQEISRQDMSLEGRSRLRVVITSAPPMAANLNAIHASLLRQAGQRLQASSQADAVEVVLVISKALVTAPALGVYVLAADGKGWDGQEEWRSKLTQPDPAFPREAEDILLAAKDYLARTPRDSRSSDALEAAIRERVSDLDRAALRSVLTPNYVSSLAGP